MRNLTFITERGLTSQFNFDPVDPWGGFDLIQEHAARLLKDDQESDWVLVEEGEGANTYEQKIFRGWFQSRGLL